MRSSPLVGRDRELELLSDALRDGRGAVLAGAAGVGKTRLLRELAVRAADDGIGVVTALATDSAAAVPFGALAGLVAEGTDATLPGTLAAVETALGQAGGERPAALMVDDAHRLDRASAALVLHLALHGEASVVVGVRSGESVPDALTGLWKDGGAVRVDLQPLDEPSMRSLLEHLLGAPAERRTREWLLGAARGNPLHLAELVRAALDGGALAQEDGLWRRVGPMGASPRLREIVDVRLADLDSQEQRALALVALAEPLALGVLEQLDALPAARTLEQRGLLAPDDGGVRVTHPLYGEVARTRLGAVEAHALRAELARALPRSRPATRRLLADWALLDGRRDDPELLTDGAVAALAQLDPEQAVAFGWAAMEADGGVEAVLPLATALRATGASAEAEALLAGYEETVRGTEHAAAYVFNRAMGLQWGLRRQEDALAFLQRALAWSPGNQWRAIVHQIAATLLVTTGRLADGIALANPIVDLPDVDGFTRLRAALVIGHALPVAGRPEEARDGLERALALAGPGEELEWPVETAFAQVAIASATGWDEAEAQLTAVREAALAKGSYERATFSDMSLIRLTNMRGDSARARRLAADAVERFTLMDPRQHAATCQAELAIAAAAEGDATGARAALDRCEELRRVWPSSLVSEHRAALAEAAVLGAEGDPAAAQRRTLQAADATGEGVLWEAEALYEHVRLGGRPATVRARLGRLEERAPDTIVGLWARHVRAIGNGRALEAMAAELERVGAWRWASEALAQAVAAHTARGDIPAADRAAARARQLSARRGASDADLRSDRMLAALRPRERDVARLVALRLSNAEIAGRLSLSVRTVESHVYRATVRLGVRSRAELAAAVQEGAHAPLHDDVQ